MDQLWAITSAALQSCSLILAAANLQLTSAFRQSLAPRFARPFLRRVTLRMCSLRFS